MQSHKWRIVWLILIVLTLFGCRSAPELQAAPLDPTPRLAILCAFEPELNALRAKTDVTDTYVVSGRTHYAGRLAGSDVILTHSGVSMVNAALTAQSVVDHFNLTGIVVSGIAGGVNPDLHIGDVVIPAQWGQYQEQLFARETESGWDTGWHGQSFGHYEMMFPQKVTLPGRQGAPNREESRFWFEVNREMLEIAEQISNEVALQRCDGPNTCLTHAPRVVTGGNGVSGSTFVDNADYRAWIWETFQANAADMETAAVAHVAYVNALPFIAFRSLSDLAGGGTGPNELPLFMELAADNSATVVTAFVAAWNAQP